MKRLSPVKVDIEGVDSYFNELYRNQHLLSHAQNGLVENTLDSELKVAVRFQVGILDVPFEICHNFSDLHFF